jgi:superfamily II DNA or RNA helicase
MAHNIQLAEHSLEGSVRAQPSTYIGAKGYTIYKECLDIAEQRLIKEELTVRPYIPKSPIQPPAYPVYRESAGKYYLPRFYGLKNYGEAEENRLPPGEDINVPFAGDLRDYQLNIVDIYMHGGTPPTAPLSKKHSTSLADASDCVRQGGCGGYTPSGLLEIPCGRGKTVIALKIISTLKKKTLVIVHKEFLMNQWIERIQQFLPSAKIGKIQGTVIDIAGKDIVIGMLQSLSMKEYPESTFHSFGLTIVDECHHISSEVFCRSLQKIITRHTLGLSATMQRKDGLTKVFKMFLGEIIYSEERDSTDEVLVKAVQYVSDGDADFNEMCYDYRGNPAYSTMISKLCAYNPRSEFILQVLQKEMQEKPGQQVMILAHNRNLLTYLHDAIEHRKLATAGYYVGGMKELDLKKSETCQVIIATYAMAAEALDIKTLTTLILATPKTDVIQAVGRILRVKHERPLVVDIIDSHEVFLSQWQKRRKYYASNNYKIMHTKSHLYASGKWTELSDSKSTVCKSTACKSTAGTSKAGASTSAAGTGTAGTGKKKGGEEVEPTNLLGKGVAAAAKYINAVSINSINAVSINAVSINAVYDEDETDYIVGKLSGKCFITTR